MISTYAESSSTLRVMTTRRVVVLRLLSACAFGLLATGCGGGSAAKTVTAVTTVTQTVTTATSDGISGPSADTTTAASTSPASGAKIADRKINQVGGDGHLLFKVTSWQIVASVPQSYDQPVKPAPGAKLLEATVTVQNNGQTSVSPFCGGSDVTLIDGKNRNFDALSQAMVGIPGNNTCDNLQPGFHATYKLVFQMPATAVPTDLALWDSDDANDYSGAASWVRVRL